MLLRHVVLVVAMLFTAGCSVTVPGQANPEGTAAGIPAPPRVPSEPATWAVSALDPCALVKDLPGVRGAPFTTAPHECSAEAGSGEVAVRVGARFDTGERAMSKPVAIGGLSAYQMWTELTGSEEPACRVDIPLSAALSVQIEAVAPAGNADTACAPTRQLAEVVAERLASPAAHTRSGPPTELGRWDACDLLEKALGVAGNRAGGLDRSTVDTCDGTVPGGMVDLDPTTAITMSSGPGLPEPLDQTDSLVDLPAGRAMQSTLGERWCDVTFVAEQRPGAPTEHATMLVKVRKSKSANLCPDANEAAAKVQSTLAGPAPEPPAAPARLGIRHGQPDDVMPAPCGTYGNTSPETCRAPVPAQAPTTAADVLAAMSPGNPHAPDVSCAILGAAADGVAGEMELAADSNGSCIGLGDGFSITLGFYAASPFEEYCSGDEPVTLETAAGSVPGCGKSHESAANFYFPAADPGAAGTVLVDSRIWDPRGEQPRDPPADERRLVELTDRVVGAVFDRNLRR